MLETSPYPLLALKLLGTACPCLEKRGDGPARRAAWAVSSVPIRWHRRPRPSSIASSAAAAASSSPGGAAATMGGFLSVVFGGGNGGESGGSRVVSLVGATMSVADSPSGPWLVVSPPPPGAGVVGGAVAVRRKCVPLRMIKGAIREHGNGSKRGGGGGVAVMDKMGRTLLRFDVLKRSRTTTAMSADGDDGESNEDGGGWDDAGESATDAIVRHLASLIEWERRRRDYIMTLGEDDADINDDDGASACVDEYDDDDDGTTPASPRSGGRKGTIAEQAQKIKHFAQREIEMQRMKKERENRKAKYVKEAGGLKYTAIAMANRS